MNRFRPSAVPLVTVDPFFSIWSMSDALYEDVTHHWTGRRNPMNAGVIIDGTFYIIMGECSPYSDRRSKNFEPYIPQIDLDVMPTRTKYTFANEMVQVELLFTSPLLMDRLDILARPVSYIEYDIQVLDGREHEIKFQFEISAECCIDSYEDSVKFGRTAQSLYCGNINQEVLAKSGDSVCIDWGYLHLADKDAFIFSGLEKWELTAKKQDESKVYKVFKEYPYLVVQKRNLHDVIVVAYDDVAPVSYMGEWLEDYYKKYFENFDKMLEAAISEYEDIKKLCESFDAGLMQDASKYGEKYEKILSLAYRQVIAGHKLVKDKKGNILFLSKECHSNGCIGTLDITYPSLPLFLKYNTELVRGMLRPIIEFAHSKQWQYKFAPHDVGQYPLADGQVYGFTEDYEGDPMDFQMPVEECGNMLLCVAALAKAEGHNNFGKANYDILKQWADYLIEFGYNPENQLCTDDFAGRLAHNCNLSLKAILGIAAFAQLFEEASYMEIAREYAARWQKEAANKEATRLVFDKEDTWSLKYNIVWDKLLDLHIFEEIVFEKEVRLYHSKMNRYGVPMDCRSDYTKLDWLMWTTIMTEDENYISDIISCVYDYINETPSRVPISDWYYTSTGIMEKFQNRTVLGGAYILLLK